METSGFLQGAGFFDTPGLSAGVTGIASSGTVGTPFAGVFQSMVEQTNVLDQKASACCDWADERTGCGDS